MSGRDQASGLRQWASLRTGHQDSLASERPGEQASAAAPAPMVQMPLAVVGLPSRHIAPVKERLGEWARLGRRWAATPESWEIVPVEADAPLDELCKRYARWALWVRSDADAFATMYRTLRLVSEHQGPRQLLALHEPCLPRQGLLDNLQKAAANYLNIELLLLAR